MLELGDYSEKEHQRIAELIKSYSFSKTIFIGLGFKHFSDGTLFFENSKLCAEYIANNQLKGAIVLLKGSRGVKLETVMEQL
jgi:UDP-N-acetylmuramoyl-tripeptide--D-alanyl-D-alanine ligase